MCTAITMLTGQNINFFARTMDFSYPIEPIIYNMPHNFEWAGLSTKKKHINKYSFIALGQEAEGMLGFFDGVNEHGLAAAALYFEGYANFNLPQQTKTPIDSIDLVHILLGNCKSIEEVKQFLADKIIVGFTDPVTKKVAPLHWIATDRTGNTITIEQTVKGLEIHENKIGVMSNSPNFNWHMTNLRNYLSISQIQKNEVKWNNIRLTPFSQGGGTNLLPGGFSSPDRFVRTSFLKSHIEVANSETEAVTNCFHILKSVFIPKGIVITDRGAYDYTKYTAVINLETCEYFIKTYSNDQIATASLNIAESS